MGMGMGMGMGVSHNQSGGRYQAERLPFSIKLLQHACDAVLSGAHPPYTFLAASHSMKRLRLASEHSTRSRCSLPMASAFIRSE